MNQSFQRFSANVAQILFITGAIGLAFAWIGTLFVAYEYLLLWKARRAFGWALLTSAFPGISTIGWVLVEWFNTGAFWHPLSAGTLASVAALGLGLACDMLAGASEQT